MRRAIFSILTFFFFFSALLVHVAAQEASKRLILKDGSYQVATKWEIKGDRVHYYSAERYAWEDLPNSLIDWNATNKFNQEHPHGANANVSDDTIKEADAEEAAERKKEEAASPQVAPGLHLPESGGVYLLDVYRGQPQLVEVVQNGGELNKQIGKNVMRAVINPIPTGSRQTIELKGPHSAVKAHEAQPAIYVDISGSTSDAQVGNQPAPQINRPDRFKIVRVQPKKDTRVVSSVKISLLGKVTNHEDVISTNAEPVNGGEWVKVVPAQPLAPGEYALVEMLDETTINMFVWDFGVDPNAPANPTAWKPQNVKEQPKNSDTTPVLGQRPK
jgi:hypothetical protein